MQFSKKIPVGFCLTTAKRVVTQHFVRPSPRPTFCNTQHQWRIRMGGAAIASPPPRVVSEEFFW